MKTFSFVKWQLKKWLPLFAVLSVLVFGVVMIQASSSQMTYESQIYFQEVPYFSVPNFSGLQLVTNMMMIPVCVIPFFVFSHRFDKNAADAYKAFPAPKRKITRTKILIGGAFILALTIITYWSFVGILGARYAATPIVETMRGYQYNRYTYYFIWYLPAFFYIVLSVLTSYAFSCTLVSFGNNGLSSFIYLVAGNIILYIGIYSLMYSFVYLNVNIKTGSDLYYMFRGGNNAWFGTHIGRVDFISETFHDLVTQNKILTNESFFSLGRMIGYFSFMAEIAIGVLCFFVKEPSGEYYGAPGARKELHKTIIYAGMAVGLLAIADALSYGWNFNASDILMIMIVSVVIYFTMVIFDKRFNLSKIEAIVLISLVAFFIVANIYVRLIEFYNDQIDYGTGGIYYGLQALSSILRNR